MTDFAKVRKSLEDRGYAVREFASAAEAAAYLNEAIDGKTVGFGAPQHWTPWASMTCWRPTTPSSGTGSSRRTRPGGGPCRPRCT